MANKSIIDIQVNDEAFKRFNEAFKAYSKDLKDQPAAYKRLNQAVGALNRDFASQSHKARIEFSAVHKAADVIKHDLANLAKSQGGFTVSVHKSNHAMKGLVGTVGHLGRGLASLARFGAVLGGITGGIGLGSLLFGLPAMAFSAMRTGIKSRQLGMTSGQLNAFNVHMANLFTSPEAYLRSIVQAQHNPQGATGLSLLTGLSIDKIGRMNAAQLGVIAAEKMHSFAKAHNNEYLQTWLEAYKLGGVFNVPEAQLLARTPIEQIRHYGAQATSAKEARALGFSANAATAEASFAIALHRAGVRFETDLIRSLSPLGPRLAQLSHALAGAMVTLVNHAFTPANIHALAEGIGEAATFLGSKKFHADLVAFDHALITAAHDIAVFNRVIHGAEVKRLGRQAEKLRSKEKVMAVRAVTAMASSGGVNPVIPMVGRKIESWWDHLRGYEKPSAYSGWYAPLQYPVNASPMQQILDELRNIYRLIEQKSNTRIPLKSASNNVGANPAMNTYMAAGQ